MSQSHHEPTLRTIEFEQHGIARKQISRNALKVTDTLQKAGYKAYVVGGGPRDLLLQQRPKDFDIGTDATPEQVKAVFPRARLIGRRFRLAHVRFGREIIEVATFRGTGELGERAVAGSGRVLRDNVFGSEAEDAIRRDFTINALMYDPSNQQLRDYTHGFEDIQDRRLRLIGDPEARYREDPVRMLRAIRFKTKLSLNLEPDCDEPIARMAELLTNIPPARLLDELLKMLLGGDAWPMFCALVDYGLWDTLFPGLMPGADAPPALVEQALKNTDERVRQGKPVTPGFLFAALFWPALEREMLRNRSDRPIMDRIIEAGERVFSKYAQHVSIHRRYSTMAKEIWMFQPRFERRRGKRAMRLLGEKRFRAAYDFLLLRGLEAPDLTELIEWWTQVQTVDEARRREMIFGSSRRDAPLRRTRKRSPNQPAPS
ncbi:MAG: polynucleotide adenylyltransferase PcnB [Pseudomonadota bacterium]